MSPGSFDLGRAYSDAGLVRGLVSRLARISAGQPPRTFMEVCGTHTMAVFRHGVRTLLPPNLRLISGPGCPVCVTPTSYLDLALELAGRPGTTIATFGDLMRVPGSRSSLEVAKARGADIRIVYSVFDAVDLAKSLGSSGRAVVFLAVGFETTSPAVAGAILQAEADGVKGFHCLVAHRRVVPALHALLASPRLRLDGFLLPGHVSVILGSGAYRFLEQAGVGGVVAGFEPIDLLRGLIALAEQAGSGSPCVENHYPRLVTAGGNRRAQAALDNVFEAVDAEWRGMGVIPASGHALRSSYARFDALGLLDPGVQARIESRVRSDEGCRCGEVLTGTVLPPECQYFDGACTPETPIGPCMVSAEGTCAAYYKYAR